MYKKNVVVQLADGLHSKVATDFVQSASKFKSSVSIQLEERCINAKSLLGVLSLAIRRGSAISIQAEGEDAQDAVQALAAMVTTA